MVNKMAYDIIIDSFLGFVGIFYPLIDIIFDLFIFLDNF